jgi:hypothetical protein
MEAATAQCHENAGEYRRRNSCRPVGGWLNLAGAR